MLCVKDLSYSFRKHQVLNHVTMELENKRYVLLGSNGSGKTTFFRCVSGYYQKFSGSITANGTDKIKIGYLPQKFGAYYNFSVRETLEYFAIIKKIDNIDSEVEHSIKSMNLEEISDVQIRKLSGGMLRRVGIAQAVLGEPDVILLDEPTAGLDIEQKTEFYKMLKNLKTHSTVILSTHILEDVRNMAEEILVLKEGKIYLPGWSAEDENLEDLYLCFRQ